MACEFAVVAILLSSEAFSDIEQLDIHSFFSIFWLITSIFLFFDSYVAFISFELYKKSHFYSYARAFYYPGIYSFYLSIIHLLIGVNLILIALASFYFLFSNILFWCRRGYLIGKDIYKNIIQKKLRSFKGFGSLINLILLMCFMICFYLLYFTWLGSIIFENLADYTLLLFIIYWIIWIVGIASIILREAILKPQNQS